MDLINLDKFQCIAKYLMNKHLHIFTDEKWTNSVVKQFIKSGELNQEFVVLFKDNSQAQAPKYALNPHLPLIKIVINSEEYDVLISKIGNYSAVFIHYLCDLKFNLIEKVVKPTKLIWMCWGQDIHKMIISDSYMPLTRKLIFQNGLWQEYIWKYTLWLRQLKFPYSRRGELLKKFDFCCPVIYHDLDQTNKKLNQKIKYLPFHYSTLEQILGKIIDSKCNGSNILVGNSSSYASNHLDVFEILKRFDIDNRKVITPLNYGDMTYGNQIEAKGQDYFGENFVGLREFLNADEYSGFIQSCSVAIFNHIRQQALGNILICLWLGIRVYLNEKGSLFKYLKTLGLPIFSIQSDLVLGNDLVFQNLNNEQHVNAKKILMAEFGKNNTNHLILNLFEELKNKKASV
jgi:dTDP-N-acetylfucosamine:lipid II N-acetylfucosaminyltransferase